MIHNHATAQDPDAKIAPARIDHNDQCARVDLSFGPAAWIIPTQEQDGFDITVWGHAPGPLSSPLAHLRLTFGPDLKPILHKLEFDRI